MASPLPSIPKKCSEYLFLVRSIPSLGWVGLGSARFDLVGLGGPVWVRVVVRCVVLRVFGCV